MLNDIVHVAKTGFLHLNSQLLLADTDLKLTQFQSQAQQNHLAICFIELFLQFFTMSMA